MVVYDRIIPSNALTSLAGLFIGASVIIVLRYILELLKTYFLDYAGQTIEKKTSESVFDKIMRYDLLRALNLLVFAALVKVLKHSNNFLRQ